MTLGASLGSAAESCHRGDARGNRRLHLPLGCFRVGLSEGTLAGRNPGHFKPRMTLEQLNKSLAHHSGGTQYAYRDLCGLRHQADSLFYPGCAGFSLFLILIHPELL